MHMEILLSTALRQANKHHYNLSSINNIIQLRNLYARLTSFKKKLILIIFFLFGNKNSQFTITEITISSTGLI